MTYLEVLYPPLPPWPTLTTSAPDTACDEVSVKPPAPPPPPSSAPPPPPPAPTSGYLTARTTTVVEELRWTATQYKPVMAAYDDFVDEVEAIWSDYLGSEALEAGLDALDV